MCKMQFLIYLLLAQLVFCQKTLDLDVFDDLNRTFPSEMDPCDQYPCNINETCSKSGSIPKEKELTDHNPCKPFGCEINVDSKHGYRCVCTEHYEHIEHPKPACIDRDECNEGREPEPCSNGGTCVNMVDGFFCNCLANFMGQYCEHQQNIIDAIEWSKWSQWSECSHTCQTTEDSFVHVRTSHRYCPIKDSCSNDTDTIIDDCGPGLPKCQTGAIFLNPINTYETETETDEEIIHLSSNAFRTTTTFYFSKMTITILFIFFQMRIK
jgi:hypothetical protein